MIDENDRSGGRVIGRRGFLAAGLAAGFGAATLGGGEPAGGPEDRGRRIQALPLHPFGKTGLRLPVLAFGGSAMVEKWAVTYGPQLPFAERVALVRRAYEKGVRYFDTSPNYGESEAILGEALRDVRDRIYLATKVGVPRTDDAILKPGEVRRSLEQSLETLRTDRADCVQLHGPVFEYEGLAGARGILAEMVKLREEKLCRYIGVTGHTDFEKMFRLIDGGAFDQALIAYGFFPKGMDAMLSKGNLEWRERCLDRARELGMGVVAMKVLGSFLLGGRAAEIVPDFPAGRLPRVREAALRWALRDGRIDLVLVGTTRPEEIDGNIGTLAGDLAFGEEDRKVLDEFSRAASASPAVRRMRVQ